MPAYLVPLDAAGCVIPLEKAILLIGRQSDCDVSITASRKISRRHCAIAVVNNAVIIRDLGSTNGVTVNGTRVVKEVTLALGDEVVIGDVAFRFQKELHTAKQTPVKAPLPRQGGVATVASQDYNNPVALPDEDRDFAIEQSVPRMRAVSKTASDYLDSGPLIPFQPSADNFQPLASDSV
ncbi:MAG: FHA domain-containing protein [Planctomycetaceae bacterium]|nr:FHA domain-containing protein [Planctomycetaceae bacterium]